MPIFLKPKTGISLVELVVAVALLSIVSLAAVQLLNMTEKTMIGSQTKLNQQLRSESISSYIYKDFARGELNDAVVSRTYTNSNMPEDLRGGSGVTLVSLFGNTNRFDGVDPRCALTEPATPSTGAFTMRADCMSRGGQTIVALMNDLITKGIILTTGLEGGIGRCSISQAITVDPVTGIATVKVDDPNCLRSGANQAQGVAKDSQVLLPRFVAYDSDDPRTFHTSMIEPPEGENPVKFAHQVTLDMGRFREFCQSSGATGG
ncbi:MAG: prepilin-type N-terminal cleavage/methylation domain-containing protein [Rhodobiaceae bacterium]